LKQKIIHNKCHKSIFELKRYIIEYKIKITRFLNKQINILRKVRERAIIDRIKLNLFSQYK